MKVNVITNTTNGKGLQRDAEIIREALVTAGIEVRLAHFLKPQEAEPADLNIFCEVITEEHLKLSKRNWIFPNPDWWMPHYDALLPQFEMVCCKTRVAQRLFAKKHHSAVFTGFCARAMLDKTSGRKRTFLHCPGESIVKGTKAVLEAWRDYQIQHPLTVVRGFPTVRAEMQQYWVDVEKMLPIPNVEVLGRITDEELTALMNSNIFHLCPSETEGFGHSIHEALNCGAVVCATDIAPMNEWHGIDIRLLIPATAIRQQRMAICGMVPPDGIKTVVDRCMDLDSREVCAISAVAHEFSLWERMAFYRALYHLL